MDLEMQTDVRLFLKELDRLVDSILKLNEVRHQVRMDQLQTQHERRIEKLIFQSWLSPYQSIEQWFDAQSVSVKEYWYGFYLKYQYNPEHQKPCLSELDFMHQQIFELLRARDLYVQMQCLEPVIHLIKSA